MPKTIMVGSSTDGRNKKKSIDVRNIKKEQPTRKTSDVVLIKVLSDYRKRAVRRIIEDYADSSSIHGLKYLISQTINTSFLGRLLWICTVIAAIVGVHIMINKFWQHLAANPEKLYVESLQAPIFLAAFPAVTICPNLPTMITRRYELLENLKLPANMSNEEALMLIKYGTDIVIHEEYLERLEYLLQENQWTLIDFLRLLKPCDGMIESCWWHGRRINCTETIRQSHSYGGICCSFNYHLEDLIKYKIRFHEVPVIHTAHSGPKSGLTVIFHRDLFAKDNNMANDNLHFVNSVKLLIYVHHPVSYANSETVAYTLQPGEGLRVSINPIMSKISNDLHEEYINGTIQSICVLNSEKSELQFFPEYRNPNCFANCRMRTLLKMCGCVRYIYAPMANYSSVPLCDIPDYQCVFNFKTNTPIVDYDNCVCLNPCEDLTYETSGTKYSLETSSKHAVSPIYKSLSKKQAVLNVHMKMDTFTIYSTEASFSHWSALAEVGGIFSLFLGCSILSAIELLYFVYLICRTICKKRRTYN